MPNNLYFDTIFADAGDVTVVPDGTQSDGSVSYEQGFTPAYSTPVASGGRDFPRAQNNQLLKDITAAVQFAQQNGASHFITTAMNGGIDPYSYTLGAVVAYDAGGGLQNWLSTTATNTTIPGAGGAHWVPLGSIGIDENAQTGTAYPPVAADIGKIIVRSNSGSPMADIIPGTSGALPAGWFGYIQNADTSEDSVTVGSGGNISVGNQGAADAFVVSAGETWLIISFGTGSYTAMRVGTATLHTRPPIGVVRNLTGVQASNTTATYTADGIVVYDANGNSKLANSFNKTLNTATTGIGGLSTGALTASTWYAVYAAINPTSGVQGIFFDPSFTAPTRPAGWTYTARIGSIRTDGSSHILAFQQFGRRVQYTAAFPVIASGPSNPLGPFSVSTIVPSVATEISMVLNESGASPNTTRVAMNSAGLTLAAFDGNTGAAPASVSIPVSGLLESTNVYFYSDNASASLQCSGWNENL